MEGFYHVGDNNNNSANTNINHQDNGQTYYDDNINTNIINVGDDYYLDPASVFFMNTKNDNNDYQMVDNNLFGYAASDFDNTGDDFGEASSAQLLSDLNQALDSAPKSVAEQAQDGGDDDDYDLTAPGMLGGTSFFPAATHFANDDGDSGNDDDNDGSSFPALESEMEKNEYGEAVVDAEMQSEGEEEDDEGESHDEEDDEGGDEEVDAMTDSEIGEDAQEGAAMSEGRVHDGQNGHDERTYRVETGAQDMDMMHSPGASTPAASEHSSENEDTGNDSLLSTLLPVDEINRSQRADKTLHEKAKALIPHSMAPDRYWIAVLNHNLLPKDVKKEKDFLWIKGNRKHTVQTIWHTYQNATAAEDSFQLWTHDEMPDLDDIMEELDFYSDKLVVFQARLPSRLANKGFSDAPIEIDDD